MSRYSENRANGLCGSCGRQPEPGKTRCAKCADSSRRSRQRGHRRVVGQPLPAVVAGMPKEVSAWLVSLRRGETLDLADWLIESVG